MNRNFIVMSVVVAALLLPAGKAYTNTTGITAGEQPQGISATLGERDYRNYCAACHGVSGTGDGTMAEFLTIRAPDLTALKKLNAGVFPRDRIREVIDGRADVRVHGGRDMPVWGDWFDREAISTDTDRDTRDLIVRDRIESVITFIETLQEN